MKYLHSLMPAIKVFLILSGLIVASCAVPSNEAPQPAAFITPTATSSTSTITTPSATPPASSVKAVQSKEEGEKGDRDKEESKKTKREGLPDIPANHLGRTACIACHASGVSDIPKLPSDHSGRTDATCVACHKQAGSQATSVASTPFSTITPNQTTGDSRGKNGKGEPPGLPSDHAGRTICTACHGTGAASAPKLPTDHSGRTDTTCNGCHKQSSSQPKPAASTPSGAIIPAPAGRDDRDKEKQTGPHNIPINHRGRATCVICHEAGLSGAPKLPANHAGRSDATCAACHKQTIPQPTPISSTPSATITAQAGPSNIPVSHKGRTTCTICHETGLMGAPKNPANHIGRTDATCAACHKQAS